MDNKKILSYCPNFDKIINTDFLEDDSLSLELVRVYQEYIFKININDEDEVSKIKELDAAMGKYVDDYFFRKTFMKEIRKVTIKRDITDIIKAIVDNIIRIFKQYEDDSTRKIYISRWI